MKRQFGSNCCNQAISLPILKQAALPDYKPNGDIPTVMCSPPRVAPDYTRPLSIAIPRHRHQNRPNQWWKK